jgi:hypothetical protein
MQAARYFRGSIRTLNWLDRFVVLSVALLLSLQLMLSGQHKDDHPGYGDNCPSCVFAHHLPSGLPDVEPVVRVGPATLAYQIADAVHYRAPSFLSYLIPESQAPPRA